MKKVWIAVFIAVVVIIGIYYGFKFNKVAPSENLGSTTPTTTGETKKQEVKIVKDPVFNNILVDENGKTLYIYTKDELNKSNCYGQCETNWPPLITTGEYVSGPGVSSTLLTTVTRTDGKKQIAYNGKPLYYWLRDTKAGDTSGQNVGKVWFVVNADGAPIQSSAAVNLVTSTPYGKILVDGSGWVLYMFTVDVTNTSKCYGDCAVRWPPLLTVGSPVPGVGLNPSLLSTTRRADGTDQVTYNKYPLYYWWKDEKPGDTKGQDVGKVWYVLSGAGVPIKQ